MSVAFLLGKQSVPFEAITEHILILSLNKKGSETLPF
ncbi:hypothetical protein VAS14_20541 [Vibrio angustum S14]|uniref:Uncharacterized protein n=1 Tax=Photobacterium angustum (strain S14 / CCUG 15956) TaxID=314292 RepID=Q1ZN85_PHOAS|nr:hypothetical protein VAS14_20541 [Vibrio angustum S14] [Photobacterium angustum S14]